MVRDETASGGFVEDRWLVRAGYHSGDSEIDVLQFIVLRGAERFEIVREQGGLAYFLFRYEGDRNTHDHFQTDVAMCRRCAKDLYGIAESEWVTPTPFELAAWQSRQSDWENSSQQA